MYPPAAFYFQIVFTDLPDDLGTDSGFQSISGLETLFISGGETAFTATYGTLILTRAAKSAKTSPLLRWIFNQLQRKEYKVIPAAQIRLLNEKQESYMQWTVHNLTPKSWKLGELHAEKSAVLTEVIELNYTELLAE